MIKEIAQLKEESSIPTIVKAHFIPLMQTLPPLNCSLVCGKNIPEGCVSYKCFDCGAKNPYHIFCQNCFILKKHKDHSFQRHLFRPGCCDCGDEDAMEKEGFCELHLSRQISNAQIISKMPPRTIERINTLLIQIFSTLIQSLDLLLVKQPKARSQSPIVKRLLSALIEIVSNMGDKQSLLNVIVIQFFMKPYSLQLHHHCEAIQIMHLYSQKKRACSCSRIELFLKYSFLIQAPKLQLSVMMYGLFQDAKFKIQLSRLLFKNLRMLIGSTHFCNLFLIYNQFFNKAQIHQFLQPDVVERHLATFAELEQIIMLSQNEQQREEVCDRLMTMINQFQFFAQYIKDEYQVKSFCRFIQILTQLPQKYATFAVKPAKYQMFCSSFYFKSLMYMLTPFLLHFKQEQFTMILKATIQQVQRFLTYKDRNLQSFNSNILKLWALLRFYHGLNLDLPQMHDLVGMTKYALKEVEEEVFLRTLQNLENAVKVQKLTGDTYYIKRITQYFYFENVKYCYFSGDLFVLKIMLLHSSNPHLLSLMLEKELPVQSCSGVLLEELPLSILMSQIFKNSFHHKSISLEGERFIEHGLFPVRSLIATIFNYQSNHRVNHLRKQLKQLEQLGLENKQILKKMFTLIEGNKFQLKHEQINLSDIASVRFLPTRFTSYCDVIELRKEQKAFLQSNYLLQALKNPLNITVRLIKHLADIVPRFSQQIFDHSCKQQNKQQAKLILRVLWLLKSMKRLQSIEMKEVPQELKPKMELLMVGNIQEAHPEKKLKEGNRMKELKQKFKSKQTDFLKDTIEQQKKQPQEDDKKESCIICQEDASHRKLCYPIFKNPNPLKEKVLQFCPHLVHKECQGHQFCGYCHFFINQLFEINSYTIQPKQQKNKLHIKFDNLNEFYSDFLLKKSPQDLSQNYFSKVTATEGEYPQVDKTLSITLSSLIYYSTIRRKSKVEFGRVLLQKVLFIGSRQVKSLYNCINKRMAVFNNLTIGSTLIHMYFEEEKICYIWLMDYLYFKLLNLDYNPTFKEMAQLLITRSIMLNGIHDQLQLYPLYRLLYYLAKLSTDFFKEDLPLPSDIHGRLGLVYRVQSQLDLHLLVLQSQKRFHISPMTFQQPVFTMAKEFRSYYSFNKNFASKTCQFCQKLNCQKIPRQCICARCFMCVCDGPCKGIYNNLLIHALNQHRGNTIYIEKDLGLVLYTNGWRLCLNESLFINAIGENFNISCDNWAEYKANGETCEKIENLVTENGLSVQVNQHFNRYNFDVRSGFIENNMEKIQSE